ncbi:hypothetical protein [Methylomonas fluvii]|nr:hypothetical protein [Methylomonas fluvii]
MQFALSKSPKLTEGRAAFTLGSWSMPTQQQRFPWNKNRSQPEACRWLAVP